MNRSRAADRRRAGQGERGSQSIRLDRRDAVENAERRPEQLQQHPERDLALGLQPGRAQHPHLGERRHGIVEQRGLADARLADEREHAARAQARGRHQPVDRLLLGLPTHQHAPSLGSRRND